MKVIKFGGSSVSTPERIRKVISIVKEKAATEKLLIVVVSALGGVTDELIRIGHCAAERGPEYLEPLKKLQERHEAVVKELIDPANAVDVLGWLGKEFGELKDALQGVALVKELSKRTLDFIMSFGERLSAYIIAVAMVPKAEYVDARPLIITDRHFGGARVRYEKTNRNIQERLAGREGVFLVTGFIATSEQQETTTLGRGGSDFTASIFGAALKADEIEIWTDVDGVMTADPRKVQKAFPIPQLTYKEALEMSHFGAKIIHPPTITPALQNNIPLRIKNTFNPSVAGTLITNEAIGHTATICGISSIDEVALFRFEGGGIVGVHGMASRLFGALAKHEINVILISQGSSEHSICFAIAPHGIDVAKEAIEDEFTLEMQAGLIEEVIVEMHMSIIAVVGENMRRIPGIAGKLFGALGRNGVNVITIVQGSSEYNISLVVKKEDEVKACNVIHEEFFLSDTTTLHLFIAGTGLIGSTLIEQIEHHHAMLLKEYSLELCVAGMSNSKKMVFVPRGVPYKEWEERLQGSGEPMAIAAFIEHMRKCNLTNSIFIDCTASQEVADAYDQILSSNISIVTPNKKAMSGPYSTYRALKGLSKQKGVKFLYETNVGAGLPIISTVINLLRSGDKILKIEGILSGTLSYIFNHFKGDKLFSEVVKDAQDKGFTEPDPREDLSGMDVKRKLLILIRESGYCFEIDEIVLEPLLPAECFQAKDVAAFYENLRQNVDADFERKKEAAQREGKVLRCIASFDKGKAYIGLHAVPPEHPFYHLSGSDNIIALTTERYKSTPLVIKGQGAGAEVTAGEVLADIIRIAR